MTYEQYFMLILILDRIMKDYTNRHMGNALKELMVRIQMEKKVEDLLHFTDDKDCKLAELFCNSHVCFHY